MQYSIKTVHWQQSFTSHAYLLERLEWRRRTPWWRTSGLWTPPSGTWWFWKTKSNVFNNVGSCLLKVILLMIHIVISISHEKIQIYKLQSPRYPPDQADHRLLTHQDKLHGAWYSKHFLSARWLRSPISRLVFIYSPSPHIELTRIACLAQLLLKVLTKRRQLNEAGGSHPSESVAFYLFCAREGESKRAVDERTGQAGFHGLPACQ